MQGRSAARPAHLVTISEFAAAFGCCRPTAHRWAAQGRLGPVTTWGGSGVALLDIWEMTRRGYRIAMPEPLFTGAQVREAIAFAINQESAA